MLLSDRDVCLSRTSGLTREQRKRPGKTKLGTEVAHLTRDSDTTFSVKGQGHQAALLTAVLARQAAAAVGVETCWPWETAATLPSPRRRKALRRSPGEERGGGISWRLPTYSLFYVHVFHVLCIGFLYLACKWFTADKLSNKRICCAQR